MAVVTLQMVLNPPIVPLRLSDSSLQVGLVCGIVAPVARTERDVPLLQQLLDLPGHPRLLVGLSLDTFVYCNSVYAVFYVAEKTVCKHFQVLMFKDIPLSPVLIIC